MRSKRFITSLLALGAVAAPGALVGCERGGSAGGDGTSSSTNTTAKSQTGGEDARETKLVKLKLPAMV